MLTNLEILSISDSYKTVMFLDILLMNHSLVPNQHIETPTLISLVLIILLHLCKKLRNMLWEIELELENSSKIMILSEKELLMLLNSEPLFMLKNYNWQLKNIKSWKITLEIQLSHRKSDISNSTSKLKKFSLLRTLKNVQASH